MDKNLRKKYISLCIALIIFIVFCVISIAYAKLNTKKMQELSTYEMPKSAFAAVKKLNVNAKPKDYQQQVNLIKELMGEISILESSVEYNDYKKINHFSTNNGYCTIQYYDDGSLIIREFNKSQVMQRTVQKSKNGKINEELFIYDKEGNPIQDIQKFQLSANELLFYFSNAHIKNRLKADNKVEYIYNKSDGTYKIKGNNLEIIPSPAPGVMYSASSIDFSKKPATSVRPLLNITIEGNNNVITGSDENDTIKVIGNYNIIDMKKGMDTVYIEGKNNTLKNVENRKFK